MRQPKKDQALQGKKSAPINPIASIVLFLLVFGGLYYLSSSLCFSSPKKKEFVSLPDTLLTLDSLSYFIGDIPDKPEIKVIWYHVKVSPKTPKYYTILADLQIVFWTDKGKYVDWLPIEVVYGHPFRKTTFTTVDPVDPPEKILHTEHSFQNVRMPIP